MFSRRLTSILQIVAWSLAGLLVLFLAAGLYLNRLSRTLPDLQVDPDALVPARTSVVYAADGSVLAEWHGEEDRTVVPFEQIPEAMRDAIVAVEDERFYSHKGVDMEAVGRALKVNAEQGAYAQGGSTITQQVVKLLFTDGERTLDRKIREALLAFELETQAEKDQVLETYLNLVYFGEGCYGVEAAAERYFGHPASSLTLAESALLAGVVRSPGRYSPIDDPEAALERRDLVLRLMREQGHISAEQEREARAEELVIAQPTQVPAVAPHFVEYVKQTLIDRLGPEKVFEGGLRVQTTLDPQLQKRAEEAARAFLSAENDPDVAIVTLEHGTGDIVAMVGGSDFSADQFNLAVQGRRQPGSAFKPFVLVTALMQGYKPTDTFSAAPYEVRVKDGIWKVQNYENAITAGTMSLAAATNWSVNAVYARLVIQVGAEEVVKTAHAMGITTDLDANPAIALGGLTTGVSPLEMASAYGTIANDGTHVEPGAIVRVSDDRGEVLWEPERAQSQAIPVGVARQTAMMLHDVVERGTGQAARIEQWSAGKTGTTQEYRDAWYVGYSGDLCTAVWVGHAEGQVPMTNVHGIRVTGGSFPARIWQRFMSWAVPQHAKGGSALPAAPSAASVSQEETGTPAAQVMVKICVDTFQRANPRCPNTVEMYLDPGHVPSQVCTTH